MEIPLFSIRKLYCNCCDHSCNDEESWKKHITNNNHVNRIGGDVKSIKIFWCKLCDVKCSGKYDWDRHINTNKHKGKTYPAIFSLVLYILYFKCLKD